jgi:hypothetical protein
MDEMDSYLMSLLTVFHPLAIRENRHKKILYISPGNTYFTPFVAKLFGVRFVEWGFLGKS